MCIVQMESDTTSKYLIKPAVMAAIVAAGALAYRPGALVQIPGSSDVPLPVIAAGVTFVAAEVCALVNEYLFPHIPQLSIISAPLHSGLNIGVQIGVTAALENYISPGLVGDLGLTELAVFATGAEIGSQYIVDQWITPTLRGWSSSAQY
jgi:hypothetical protein